MNQCILVPHKIVESVMLIPQFPKGGEKGPEREDIAHNQIESTDVFPVRSHGNPNSLIKDLSVIYFQCLRTCMCLEGKILQTAQSILLLKVQSRWP